MKWIFICSPLRGNMEQNKEKAREYCREVMDAGAIPVCPHIYFTQFSDDNIPEERRRGMDMGKELLEQCDEIWVYGLPSEGMEEEIFFARQAGTKVVYKNV